MKMYSLALKCQHEPWCSEPGTYCRYVEKMETLDKHGSIIEVVEPGFAEKDVATITCVECGKKAWYGF